jgi:PAS domain S-box-containing protein
MAEAQPVSEAQATGGELSQRTLLRLIENTVDGIAVVDVDGVVRFANPAATRLFLHGPEGELVGSEFGHPLVVGEIAEIEVPQTGRIVEMRASEAHVPWTALRWLVWLRDITERRAVESERAQLAAIVQSSQDAIMSINPAGVITSWNDGAAHLYGYAAEEAVGTAAASLLTRHEHEVRTRTLHSVLAGEGPVSFESTDRRKDGSFVEVSVTDSPLPQNGSVVGVARIARDITERRRLEREVRTLNAELEQRVAFRTEELEGVLSSASHDLRAPLRALNGFSKLLAKRLGPQLDDVGRDYLGRISNAADRMGAMIDDLLELSRISRAEPRRAQVDLGELARDTLAELQRATPERNVEVTIASGLTVCADPELMRTALDNLLGNAWKFTATRDRARIEVGERKEDGEHVFFVRDDGIGFDMAYADKLFRPFHRLHHVSEFPGTGIGLVSVQRIIARHGGRIWAHAEPDAGATFSFTLQPAGAVE